MLAAQGLGDGRQQPWSSLASSLSNLLRDCFKEKVEGV